VESRPGRDRCGLDPLSIDRPGEDAYLFAESNGAELITTRTQFSGTNRRLQIQPALDDCEKMRLGEILWKAEADLTNNVLPFWAKNTWDEEYGGFITHLDRTGKLTGITEKFLVMQGRIIWSLSAAHRFGLRYNGYLELARKGVRFMIETMWDKEHGGFFWSVKRDGTPKQTRKRLVGHPYMIYALPEYAMASGDKSALVWADRVVELIQEKASDGELGFFEEFTRDWKPAWSRTRYRKTLCTHLAFLESFTNLARATGNPKHRDAVDKLLHLLLTKTIHKQYGCALEDFDRHWRPRRSWQRKTQPLGFRTSYGHNVKLAWLILEAADTVGISRDKFQKPVLGLIDHALRFGFDATRGGIAMYGPLTGAVTETRWLDRKWWDQAELLVAFLEAFRWTGDRKYLEAFQKQFDWVWKYQIDHEGGDWYELTSYNSGRPLIFNKGHAWKTLYHNSRALMRISQGLRAMNVQPVHINSCPD
jgi:mannose/cellobiose epimerase-like protein (N-acyl-D-glucosamine 2-epimerase family)